MSENLAIAAILGAGGQTPCAAGVLESGALSGMLLALGPGHSVYCADVDEDGALGLAGTREGALHVFDLSANNAGSAPRVFHQGAPLLSACFMGSGRLATSDTANRLLFWDIAADSAKPVMAYEDVAPIVALGCTRSKLVGQRVAGGLLAWNLEGLGEPARIDGPPPTSPFARAESTYWSAADAMVLRTDDGRAILYNVDGSLVSFPLRDVGDFGAASALGELLVTFGRESGVCCAWRSKNPEPVFRCTCPQGVVAAACIDEEERRFVLVLENGCAATGVLDADGMAYVQMLPGRDYRVIAGFPPKRLEAGRRKKRTAEIEALRKRLDATLDGASNETADQTSICLERLEELEAKRLVCAFRAQAAARSGDDLAELRYRLDLDAHLPDAPGSLDSRIRFAALLERLQCYREAASVWVRISRIAPEDTRATEALSRLHGLAESLFNGGILVTDTPTSLPSVVRASDLLGVSFAQRFLLKQLDPICFRGVRLDPGEVLRVYEAKRPNQRHCRASGCVGRMALVRDVGAPETHCGVSFRVDPIFAPGLEVALIFRPVEFSTLAVPCVVFNGGSVPPDLPHREHNAACLGAYEGFTKSAETKIAVREIHTASLAACSAVANRLTAANLRRITDDNVV